MEKTQFIGIRNILNKTQKQMAELLGTSLQTIRSYEQGWRAIPGHVERHTFFLLSRSAKNNTRNSCWTVNDCPEEFKEKCPAWEFNTGEYCWLINGTFCKGTIQINWEKKMKICRTCEMITSLLT